LAGLPLILRKGKHTLDLLHSGEWVFVIYYIIFVIFLSVQITFYFFNLIDVFNIEYNRIKMLSSLFSKRSCDDLFLPEFNFTVYSNILAWMATREYVRKFSQPDVGYWGGRLVSYFVYLIFMVASVAYIYFYRDFNSNSLFLLLVITLFLSFLIYTLFIIVYGVLSNNELNKHRQFLSEKLLYLHEHFYRSQHEETKHEAKNETKNEETKEKMNKQEHFSLAIDEFHHKKSLLNDVVKVLQSSDDQVKLLGVALEPSVVASVGSLLVTIGGLVLPVLVRSLSDNLLGSTV